VPAKTDLTITSTDNVTGKKVTDKISYVNPNITNSQAVTLAQAVNALTKNTYTSTTRTDQTDCDTPKATRAITINALHWGNTQNANVTTSIGDSNNLTVKITPDATKTLTLNTRIIGAPNTNDFVPYWTDLSVSSDTDGLTVVHPVTTFYGGDYGTASLQNVWSIDLQLSQTQTAIVTGTINIPETREYAAYSRTLTFNVVTLGE